MNRRRRVALLSFFAVLAGAPAAWSDEAPAKVDPEPVIDWAAVLYHGSLDHPANLPAPRAVR